MLNKVMIIGRLGRDPELRYTQSGSPVASLNVATDESSLHPHCRHRVARQHDVGGAGVRGESFSPDGVWGGKPQKEIIRTENDRHFRLAG